MTAPTPPAVTLEPLCCGEPMVHYPGVSWECSAAFFRLQDDQAIEDNGCSPPRLNEDAGAFHRGLHAHLLATRVDLGDADPSDFRVEEVRGG